MPTTNSAFVRLTAAQLVGSTVRAAGRVVAVNESNATQIVAGGSGVRIDKAAANLATDGYAANGAITLALTGTTAVDVDITDLSASSGVYDGDATFTKWNKLVFMNLGAGSATVKTGASNGATLPFNGTNPTLTVPAGTEQVIKAVAAGVTVDATHKVITVTPAADTTFTIAIGGA